MTVSTDEKIVIDITSMDNVDILRGVLRQLQQRHCASQIALVERLLEFGELSKQDAETILMRRYTDMTSGTAHDAFLKVKKVLSKHL